MPFWDTIITIIIIGHIMVIIGGGPSSPEASQMAKQVDLQFNFELNIIQIQSVQMSIL